MNLTLKYAAIAEVVAFLGDPAYLHIRVVAATSTLAPSAK